MCCLGDIVGWLPWGKDTLQKIVDMNIPCVAGNHDLLVTGALIDDPRQIDRMQATAYNAGTIWQDEQYISFLEALPLRLDFADFRVVHHSPFDLPEKIEAVRIEHFSYLNTERLQDYRALWVDGIPGLVFSGHDHIPMIIAFHEDGRIENMPVPVKAGEWKVELKEGTRYWVKAGSVGGPYRDGVAVVNSVSFDDEEKTVTFHRIRYDTSGLIDGLRNHRFFRNITTIQKYIRTAKAWDRP
ncbi:Calcineurin-like phosphoesterase superfamily domain-containing protein [Thermodesulforhabdus norvegica]|uniref:Calcineurin-like phosphoesterase superfamily domain-containing protein n=1 Tax=Thermodesulforhabdus norvegica TaxID=39841 RepID=A0A1I4V5D1_9BACT|nr:Calcineurin-like phosphoesterase superfamily domain-containing protein [Thermodesulforhabdus norvegica]